MISRDSTLFADTIEYGLSNESIKPEQLSAVQCVLWGENAISVPTGFGKSLCIKYSHFVLKDYSKASLHL